MGAPAASAVARLGVHTWDTFVRPAVKTIPLTREIIQKVMPYFPKAYQCLAGFLDSEDQYWKVNYHWELLEKMVDTSLSLQPNDPQLTDQQAQWVNDIWDRLWMNPPRPRTGYTKSKVVGEPRDASDHATINARWRTLRQAKRDFGAIVEKAGLPQAGAGRTPAKTWYLSYAPLAAPGTSKHGTGYALDIAGPSNDEIKRISQGLGASLAFNEKSHVHVEFANGVKTP